MELEVIQSRIYAIRGQKVMLDFDLAALYKVETRVLNQAVKRNLARFPNDFIFSLTLEEWTLMSSQIVMTSGKKRPKSALPLAFTEQGVAMLSGVLHSEQAIEINIAIMRAFVLMRQYALSHQDLTEKLKELENRYDKQFKDVYDAIHFLVQKDDLRTQQQSRKRIGFSTTSKK